MAAEHQSSKATTLHIHTDVRDRLKELKPYPSMSFNDLLEDMADQYDQRGHKDDS